MPMPLSPRLLLCPPLRPFLAGTSLSSSTSMRVSNAPLSCAACKRVSRPRRQRCSSPYWVMMCSGGEPHRALRPMTQHEWTDEQHPRDTNNSHNDEDCLENHLHVRLDHDYGPSAAALPGPDTTRSSCTLARCLTSQYKRRLLQRRNDRSREGFRDATCRRSQGS